MERRPGAERHDPVGNAGAGASDEDRLVPADPVGEGTVDEEGAAVGEGAEEEDGGKPLIRHHGRSHGLQDLVGLSLTLWLVMLVGVALQGRILAGLVAGSLILLILSAACSAALVGALLGIAASLILRALLAAIFLVLAIRRLLRVLSCTGGLLIAPCLSMV